MTGTPEFQDNPDTPSMSAEDFIRVQGSEDFSILRRTFRSFAFPMTVAFLVWYFGYVLLSTFAREFMQHTVPGMQHLNVGLLLGLLQFITTFLITWLYVRHANKHLDPLATSLRHELEGDVR